NDLLERLGHSHVGVFPASLYEDLQGDQARGATTRHAVPGFDVRVADGEAGGVRVSAGLPAGRAGVRPGWRIHRIDGVALAPALARVRQGVKNTAQVPFLQAVAVLRRLRGEEGKEIPVTFLDGAGQEVTLSIRLARPRGNRVLMGQLPV